MSRPGGGRRRRPGPVVAVGLVAAGASMGIAGWLSRGVSLPPQPAQVGLRQQRRTRSYLDDVVMFASLGAAGRS
jgi:hypothetical protein